MVSVNQDVLSDSRVKELKAEYVTNAKSRRRIKRELIVDALKRRASSPAPPEEEGGWSEAEQVLPAAKDVRTSGWECPDTRNTFGSCVYNHQEDGAHDDCLFCHAPEERK